MTSRERVFAALQRKPVDRVPVFMWFHPETAAILARHLDIPASLVDEALGNDVRQVWVGNNYAMEGIVHEKDGETHKDAWGITWVREGSFNQVRHSPLADATDEKLASYAFPYGAIPALMLQLERLRPFVGTRFIGCDVSPCLFELLCRVRGMEQAIEDLALQPEVSASLFERATEFGIALADAAFASLPLDWLWTGDDVAGQQCMMMNPRQWRSLIKPRLARIVAAGTTRGVPVAYHCCGAMREIMPDLIEIGITIVNPIQYGCAGMDASALKRDFGGAVTFMGGLDTIGLIPRGTAAEVLAATHALIDTMTSDGGGFILAASHTIPPETPIENILAMYAAAGITREEIFDAAAAIRTRVSR
jgi:uroporphyrinogen decarboxylase